MSNADKTMREIIGRVSVIPVYTPGSVEQAVEVAQALFRGGLPVIEVTLRTPIAIYALKAMMEACPDAIIGAGTVLTTKQMDSVKTCGAAFAVSPGGTMGLIAAARANALPYLPGIGTASELMSGIQAGLNCFKLFPAAQIGGTALLSAFAGPFPDVRFCPTGGISLATARDYLKLGNVSCVGGSWITTAERLNNKDWQGIEDAARETVESLRASGTPS